MKIQAGTKLGIIASIWVWKFKPIKQFIQSLPSNCIVVTSYAKVKPQVGRYGYRIVTQYCQKKGIEIVPCYFDINRYFKEAEYYMNKDIIDNSEAVVVFWKGGDPITKKAIELVQSRSLPLKIIRVNPEEQ